MGAGPNLDGAAADASQICMSTCAAESFQVSPTPGIDGVDVRPWIEGFGGDTNVGLPVGEAMACAIQLGVAGCAYEQPLEAMRLAIGRMQDAADPAYGFLRDDAAFSVVFVGNEDDCSINDAVAFTDLAQSQPSAACWRAGSTCAPAETPGMLDCVATSQGPGGPLHEIDRYVRVFEDLAETRPVSVDVIGGAPSGVSKSTPYPEPATPEDARFGVGPGCSSSEGEGRPPLRLMALAAAIEPGDGSEPEEKRRLENVSSVCEDHSPAYQSVLNSVRSQVVPQCFEGCPADRLPGTPGLQPECRALADDGEEVQEIPACEDGQVPEGAARCFVTHVDEEVEAVCVDQGSRLSFELVRDPKVPMREHLCFEYECTLSAQPELDCPG